MMTKSRQRVSTVGSLSVMLASSSSCPKKPYPSARPTLQAPVVALTGSVVGAR